MDLTAAKLSESVQWRAHQNSSGQLHRAVEGVRSRTRRGKTLCVECAALQGAGSCLTDASSLASVRPQRALSHTEGAVSQGLRLFGGSPPST